LCKWLKPNAPKLKYVKQFLLDVFGKETESNKRSFTVIKREIWAIWWWTINSWVDNASERKRLLAEVILQSLEVKQHRFINFSNNAIYSPLPWVDWECSASIDIYCISKYSVTSSGTRTCETCGGKLNRILRSQTLRKWSSKKYS